MAILMEVIHELRHTSEETFAEYVQVYGETTVVALEAAGEEVLGGWRWLTGDHTRDLLLIRADSMADMEAKEAAFGESMESVLESLMPFIGNMEERTGYRIPLPWPPRNGLMPLALLVRVRCVPTSSLAGSLAR